MLTLKGAHTLHPPCEVGKIYAEGNVLYHMYEKKYTSLVNRFNTVESRLKEVKATIVDKQARRDEVEYFIEDLKKQDLLTVFDENVWLSMVAVSYTHLTLPTKA